MNPIELGKFIANLRNEKNLTQEDLAEKLFIDKRKISRWECGTSVPDFDMLIKLSKILDVSLYELSICKRIENESIKRRIINKFKNAKDYKKHIIKNKIKSLLLLIFFIIFIITAIYTIKHNGTVFIYELNSLDNNYYIEGSYIKTGEYKLFQIRKMGTNTQPQKNINSDCEYEIFNKDETNRSIYIINNDNKSYYESTEEFELGDIILLQVTCINKKKSESFNFFAKLTKKYDNKLF